MSAAVLPGGRASAWIPTLGVALPCAALALLAAVADTGRPQTLPLALAIALLTLGALVRPFEPAPGEKFSLAAAVAFFGVLVLPSAQAIAAIAVAEIAARLIRRSSLQSSIVNVSKSLGAAGAAAASVETTRLSVFLAPDLLEVLVAGALYLAVTLLPIAAMIGWTQGSRAGGGFVARETLPTATLLTIGALGAAVWASSPLLIVLLAFPLAMVEVAGRAAARLRRTHGALAKALDAQRAFVADAAHELRTPLTAIRGNLAFVRESTLVPDEEAALADARRDVAHLAALVERLLMLSRADATGAGEGCADLAAIARSVAAQHTPRPGVRLDVSAEGSVAVAAPPELIEALVRDIVGNATAYTDSGAVEVRVRTRGTTGELEVRDTGIGIAPAELPRVFDRFFRGAAARRMAPGSGLGLAIARRIALAHGGNLTILPVPTGGTQVLIELPLAAGS